MLTGETLKGLKQDEIKQTSERLRTQDPASTN